MAVKVDLLAWKRTIEEKKKAGLWRGEEQIRKIYL